MTPSGLGSVPTRGLLEVLSSWARAGAITTREALTAALGLLKDLDVTTAWSTADVERRADRIAWELLRPLVAHLPESERDWINALPAIGTTHREWSTSPSPPVDWRATVRSLGGWPPRQATGTSYLRQRRDRAHDEDALRALGWVRHALLRVQDAAASLGARVSDADERRVLAIPELVAPALPARADDGTDSLRALGRPFADAAACLSVLVKLYDDPMVYARELLLPDPELRGRLFHLGVYGEVIAEARDRHGSVVATKPLSGSTFKANHVAVDPLDQNVVHEFWFEASGIWRSLGTKSSPHGVVARAVKGAAGSLRPDIAIVKWEANEVRRVCLLECKDSTAGGYVFGGGFAEALGYGIEAAHAGGVPTLSLAVGPEAVMAQSHSTIDRDVGGVQLRTGVAGPSSAAQLAIDWA